MRRLGLSLAALVIVLDQLLKWWIVTVVMNPPREIEVTSFFDLVMVWNPGVSYGLFAASSAFGTAVLVLVSLAAVAGLGYWLWSMVSLSLAVGVGLVIGGALGNLIDRLVYGRVADFFHFYGFGYDWYVFNVADIAITLGAVAIIYEVVKPQAEA